MPTDSTARIIRGAPDDSTHHVSVPLAHASAGPPLVHERILEGVPESVAEQIARDFVAYETEPSEAARRKLYTFEGAAEKTMLALDFAEVLAVTATQNALAA